MPASPSDVGRLGSRYQVRVAHSGSARTLVASRVQSIDPSARYNTEIYNELGSVDPVGYGQEPPEFRIAIEENVFSSQLDLLLAGKASNATTWNLGDYIGNSLLSVFILERDTANGTVMGEVEFQSGVVTEINWSWRIGQPITARYSIDARLGVRHVQAYVPHASWGTQDTTNPGAIRSKDARLFLISTAAGGRMYRLQGFNIRVTFRSNPVKEIGNRAVVGYVVEPPETFFDFDVLAADHQPDELLFSGTTSSPAYAYYDYVNPVQLSQAAIRIYDPTLGEAASVLRTFLLDSLVPDTVNPLTASVRGLATKRYNLRVSKASVAGTGGCRMTVGDL